MNSIIRGVVKTLLSPFFHGIVSMPGQSHKANRVLLDTDELAIKAELYEHIEVLSAKIDDRSLNSAGLEQAASYIETVFEKLGYKPESQHFMLGKNKLRNIEAVLPGNKNPERVIVLGAHYDTVKGTPGADDNASGVAALLVLARLFAGKALPVTVRFVAFTNEETYDYPSMGSYQYAKACFEAGDQIMGMYSLEMLGSFSSEEGTQKYPFPFSLFYPSKGNFIGFVGNTASRSFLHQSISAFRKRCEFPSEGCAAPGWLSDASRSDHLSFWKFGYPALMLTDTSNFRYPHYHGNGDTIDKLDFDAMARIVSGFSLMLKDLSERS